jgi:hypothetical protein
VDVAAGTGYDGIAWCARPNAHNKSYNTLGQDNPSGNAYGKWKLAVPREQFVGAMKRDVAYYKVRMGEAQLI